jgi:predicted RNA-binding Zn ribbon-like protein
VTEDSDFHDGNALAGPLREIFAVDVTAAVGRCAACGWAGAVATLRVYSHAPGLVARCPGCEAVMLRVVRAPDRAWLDLRGTVSLQVPLETVAADR